MKIKRPYLSRLSNELYVQLMKEHRDIILEIGADKLKIQNYFETVFMALLTQLLAVFNNSRASFFTEALGDADSNRDDAYYSLGDMVKSLMRSRKIEIRQAAKRVNKRIELNGNITRKSMDSETAFLNDLIYDLEKDYAGDIVILGIEPLIKDIKDTNQEFNDLMKNRYKETAKKSDVTASDIRKQLDEVFRNTCNMIEMFSIMEPSDTYLRCIKAFNAVFTRYASSGRKSKKTAEDIAAE